MLLEKLCEYSQRLDDLAPFGYGKTAIRWLINLDEGGNFLPPLIPTSSGRKNDRGKVFIAPAVMKSVNVKASLLVGNAEYVLGKPRPSSKSERVAKCHKAFVKEVRDCAESLGSPYLQAILRFLESLDLNTLPLPDDFDPATNLTFQVEGLAGLLPFDLPEVRAYWAQLQKGGPSAPNRPDASACLICGVKCIPAKRHSTKIKGIPGEQKAGMTLVSANKRAFESYGLKASHIAPICKDCAERYAKAANALMEKEGSHLEVGPLVYLFWTKEKMGFDIVKLYSNPEPEEVKKLLSSAIHGSPHTTLDEGAFYVTGFSASGSRVAVRYWLETTIGNARRHLARWFVLQKIVDWDGSEWRPMGIFELTAHLVSEDKRPKNIPDFLSRGFSYFLQRKFLKELPPIVPWILLKLALQGGILPSWLFFQVIKRNLAERDITPQRAALIKMMLLCDKENLKEDFMVCLDKENRTPAYLCGRLLSVLERIQKLAIDPGATIIDRFYGGASTIPGRIFPSLVHKAQHHLRQLGNDKKKNKIFFALQRDLDEILGNLCEFPLTLQLPDQGWFILGYYHQRAWDRAQAKARKEAQVPGEEAVVEETLTDEEG